MHKTLPWRPSHLESKPVSLQDIQNSPGSLTELQGHCSHCCSSHSNHTSRTFLAPGLCPCCIFYQKQISPGYLHSSLPSVSFWPLLNVTSSLNPYQIIWIKIANLLSFAPPNSIPYPSFLFCSMAPIMRCVTYFVYSLRFYRMPLSIIAQATVKQKLLTDCITILSLMNRRVPHIL